ncbi:hypothetical protein EXU57_09795 [Segetibacter sp. 3557_3]|uniref:hypothetical protein n=1 Tax=Segetibacter sp. 3557_3 TaxID=2547429 RepID=UPI0010590654|nr:hypothetical protein [Segetibacter sp. 3557_3]TDH26384.1 hypothetical protein EXU57_09795 [Segetibacter sp. 3557_3]
MKQIIFIGAIALAGLFHVSTPTAQNIHFVGTPTINDLGTQLEFCGKLAGLGNNALVTVTLSTTAETTSICTNPGGKVAPGQTKTETVVTSGTFESDKNGSVTFCLTTDTPTPGKCPNARWTGTVTDVTFSNTSISVNGQVID